MPPGSSLKIRLAPVHPCLKDRAQNLQCGTGEGRPQFLLQPHNGRIKDRSRSRGEEEPRKGDEKEKDKDKKPQDSKPVLPEESPELLPPRLPRCQWFLHS